VRCTATIAAAVLIASAAAAGCGDQAPARPAATGATAVAAPPARPAPSPPLTTRPAGRIVHVGALPDAIAADPRAHSFAVAIHDPSRLALVDSRGGRVRQRVAIPVGAGATAATPAVFLVPAETGKRAVAVAPATRTPPTTLPQSAAVVLGRTFVTNSAAGAVDVLDRGRPTARLGSGSTRPGGIAAADFDRALAVVSIQRRTIELYDARSLRRIAARPAGRGPTNVVAFGDVLFVADTRGRALLTFSTRPHLRAVARTPLPGAPYGLAIDPVRGRVHVTLTDVNELATLPIGSPRSPPAIRPTVRQPDAVAVDSSTGTIAVAGRADGVLELITGELSGALPARHAGAAG
jgi:DNA-binding beta-propeller fold protein YncE